MNKRRVLIFTDNSKRDLLGNSLLERALIHRGAETARCNEHTARVMLRKFMPHAFICPRGNHLIARQASELCKVFILPGEGGRQTKETMLSVFLGRGYSKIENVDWISKCYLWSDRTQRWLLETGMFHQNQLLVTGTPRLDIYRNDKVIRELSSNQRESFRLGVAFSAGTTSTYYGAPKFAQTYFEMNRDLSFPVVTPGRHFEDIVWRDHAILRNAMRSLRMYLELGKGEVWLRPNPFENSNEYIFLEREYPGRVKVLQDQPLTEFLCGVDALLSCWSTVGIEALLLGKPVISISGLLDQEHLFSHISRRAGGFDTFVSFFHQPTSDDHLRELLLDAERKKLAVSPKPKSEVQKLLVDLYSWPGVSAASDRIAEDVLSEIKYDEGKNRRTWAMLLPLRFPFPLSIYLMLTKVRSLFLAFRTGQASVYLRFLRVSDSKVNRLLEKLES